MEIIQNYFGDFSEKQLIQFRQLEQVYTFWNEKVNVISRKDMDSLYAKHVLHSLAIAALFEFVSGQRILDLGTGGGFPGIPLAIFFPETEFILVDSIQKKIKVVDEVVKELQLKNVTTRWGRAEERQPKLSVDMVVSRAVAPLGNLWSWSKPLIRNKSLGEFKNGLVCLKGGDLNQEISESNTKPMLWKVHDIFPEDIFQEKFVVYVRK